MNRTILATVLALVLGLVGTAVAADPILTLSGSAGKPLVAPRVAFNTIDRLYLAVYEFHYGTTDWDIDGRIVDPNGQLAGDGLAIAWKGSIVQQEPDVAYNPVTNEFLVVYALAPDNWKISACIVAGDGTPGPFVPIATSTFKEYHPSVACDPITGEYLVAYEREHMLDGTVWRAVWAQWVHRDGTLAGDPFQISNPGLHSLECAVACAGSQFVVVWREQPAKGKGRIWARVFQCGLIAKSGIPLSSPDDDSQRPQIAYNTAIAEYLVVYQAKINPAARWQIKGTRVSTLIQMKTVSTIAAPADVHCKAPHVACTPADGQYVVTWAQGVLDNPCSLASHQIMAQGVDCHGVPVGDPQPVSAPAKDQPANVGIPAPAIAAGVCGKALIVWEDQRLVLDPNGPSTTIYSILGAHGTWGSLCSSEDCNSVD